MWSLVKQHSLEKSKFSFLCGDSILDTKSAKFLHCPSNFHQYWGHFSLEPWAWFLGKVRGRVYLSMHVILWHYTVCYSFIGYYQDNTARITVSEQRESNWLMAICHVLIMVNPRIHATTNFNKSPASHNQFILCILYSVVTIHIVGHTPNFGPTFTRERANMGDNGGFRGT